MMGDVSKFLEILGKLASDDDFRKEYAESPEKCLTKYEIKVPADVQATLPDKHVLVEALKNMLEGTLVNAPRKGEPMTLTPRMAMTSGMYIAGEEPERAPTWEGYWPGDPFPIARVLVERQVVQPRVFRHQFFQRDR